MSVRASLDYLWWWLIDFQVGATLLLSAALMGAGWVRQPARRVALGWATVLGLLLLGVAAAVPELPRWHRTEPTPARRSLSNGAELAAGGPAEPGQWLKELPADKHALQQVAQPGPRPGPSVLGLQVRRPTGKQLEAWLGGGFVLGAMVVCLWLLVGRIEVSWLCRRARPAPASLQERLREVMGGEVTPPRLLLSEQVQNAVALGVARPAILLPAALAQQSDEQGLRAVLAHEAAHIGNRDLWLLALVRGLLVVLYSHPLYWAIRRMIRNGQEAVADAVAVERSGDDYAEGLIRWMRGVSGGPRVLAAATVGIWERPSELSRRISMLIDEQFRVQTRVSRGWRAGVVILGGAAALGLSLLTLRPAVANDTRDSAGNKAEAITRPGGEPIANAVAAMTSSNKVSFTGRVIDKLTKKPIAGATVRVRRENYSATEHQILEETEHLTDAEGRFVFELTPEQAALRSAYLNFEVTHPKYARRPWDGYSLKMIRKNESLGERPFFQDLDLTPAESVSGKVVRPDGAPAAGVKVLTYSKASKSDMAEYGSFADTHTDAAGLFRLNVAQGGEAVLWLLPEEYAPSTHLLHQQRGDLGSFTLEDGIRLQGRVLDSEGQPVSPVWVNAELYGGPAKKAIGMPVADALGRSALTDANGQFRTGPVPPGDYDLIISEYARNNLVEDRTRYPVPDVFVHQKLHVDAGQAQAMLELRAVPHVLVAIQQLDSQGKPFKTHEIMVSGALDNNSWWGEGRPDQNGRIELKLPRGLTKARFTLMVNEHQSTRYRWAPNGGWRNEHEITLPLIDEDVDGVAVMYYTAPVLLVRAVSEDGGTIGQFRCQLAYAKDRKTYPEAPHWISGAGGDVNFEKQQDGRWRSESLLPDETFSLTVQADGFQTWTQSLMLSEGATREVVAKLQKPRD